MQFFFFSVKTQISEMIFYAGLDAVLLEGCLLAALAFLKKKGLLLYIMATGKLFACRSS